MAAPNDLGILIGGAPAAVEFAGLVGNGLYQFNIVIPDVADGDQTVTARLGGLSTQTTLRLTVCKNVCPPTGLTATAGNAQVTLSWNAAPGAASYTVSRSNTPGGPYDLIASGLSLRTYTDTRLVNGNTYYYVVQAVNSARTSGNSNQAVAMPQDRPPAPTGLTATAGDAEVSLSWNASAGAASYVVLRSISSSGPYASVATSIRNTSYTDTGLTYRKMYFYVVRAVSAGGISDNSNEASAAPQPPPGPTPLGGTFAGPTSDAGRKIAFTVDSTGTRVSTMALGWANVSCTGGGLLSISVPAGISVTQFTGPMIVADGAFSANVSVPESSTTAGAEIAVNGRFSSPSAATGTIRYALIVGDSTCTPGNLTWDATRQ